MGFIRAQLDLNVNYHANDGIISSEHLFLIKDADRLAKIIIDDAELNAKNIRLAAEFDSQNIIEQATDEAQKIENETAEKLEEQLKLINNEWQRALQLLEPTVVALAGLAVSRICNDLSLSEKVNTAVQAAMRELPERAVKLRLPVGASTLQLTDFAQSLQLSMDHQLQLSAASVEGETSLCHADFKEAQKSVIGTLEAWIHHALAVIKSSST